MQLEAQLEAVNGCFIHPNPVQYDLYGSDPEWPYGCGMFTALSFSKEDGATPGLHVDMRPAISQFMDVIAQWSDRDAHLGQFKLRLKRIPGQAQLPEYARDPEAAKRKKRALDAAGLQAGTAVVDAKKARAVPNGK